MPSILNATTTGGLVTSADNSGSLQLQTNNGTTAVTIDTSQNVGIGTTTPTSTSGGTTLAVKSSTHANMVGEVTTVDYSAIWEGRRTGRSTTSRFAQVNLAVDSSDNGSVRFYTAPVSNDITERMRITSGGDVSVVTAAKLGYGTGAGGTVTQATNKSTAVTLNKPTGRITTNNAALGAGATVSFSVNCNVCSATDLVLLAVTGGSSYTVQLQFVSGGVFNIRLTNTTGGSLSEAVDISYAIISGSTS